MTNFECCPKCGGESKVQAKIQGIQHRKCKSCAHNFRTRIVSADKASSVKQILADYGHAVNAKIIKRLENESSLDEIRAYLANQVHIISHYELENQPVKNQTGFMMNAILTHYPMPPTWYDDHPMLNGNGYHHDAVAANIPPPSIKSGAADKWAGILERLEPTMARPTFEFLLRGSKGVYQSDSMLVVQVGSREAMDVLEERLAKTIFEESEGLELRFII